MRRDSDKPNRQHTRFDSLDLRPRRLEIFHTKTLREHENFCDARKGVRDFFARNGTGMWRKLRAVRSKVGGAFSCIEKTFVSALAAFVSDGRARRLATTRGERTGRTSASLPSRVREAKRRKASPAGGFRVKKRSGRNNSSGVGYTY